MKAFDWTAGALVVIGALNWGLVGLAEFDLVAFIFGMEFGQTNALTRVVYGLVGLSAVYHAVRLFGPRSRSAGVTAQSSHA
ncbi:MAG TPA: DUF378 domain-containing protein [Egibacteraceae bacterium]|nr:DUF378 domain-containing protein [Egibacteraceae bacterium]